MTLADALLELQRLTEQLRRECPWDREQTERTIVPHTIEEAYEVADAAVARDDEKLLDELGDLLFQVYFLSLLLEERGRGDLAEVARRVHEKLVRRHPHVFGDVEARTAGRVRENWDRIKAEQEEGRDAIFHHVPETLPALLYARKLQRRAAAIGFAFCAFLTGPSAWMTCQPSFVCTGFEISFVFSAKATFSNCGSVLMQPTDCFLQIVYLPPVAFDPGSCEYFVTSFAKSAPFLSIR